MAAADLLTRWRRLLAPSEEALQPVGQARAFSGGPLVVCQVVGVYRGTGFTEEGAGVPQTRLGGPVGEGGLDQIVAVPADAVDAKACELVLCKAAVEV